MSIQFQSISISIWISTPLKDSSLSSRHTRLCHSLAISVSVYSLAISVSVYSLAISVSVYSLAISVSVYSLAIPVSVIVSPYPSLS